LFTQVLRQLGTKDYFFNVVISDIDMPVMSGLEFYQKAVEMDPEIRRHFLFCSGNITSDIETFCRERDLMHLEKPFKLKQLYAAVQDIMEKTP
jgi:DNA-binding NtrC family response regulator